MVNLTFSTPKKIEEKAPHVSLNLDHLKKPRYGHYLQEFHEGEIFVHPRGLTLTEAFCQEFATTFMEANPLYLNVEYAKAHGFKNLVASPLMVLNIALSLGVQNDSEKAIAHLGYYDVHFPRPAYPGDTIRSLTKVLARQERGEGNPGIVTVRTLGLNQRDEVVVQYDRKIMIPPSKGLASSKEGKKASTFPEADRIEIDLPKQSPSPSLLTGSNTYFEDFQVGDIVIHPNGRTITDEHFAWTYRVGNTHPLHYDKIYTAGLSGPMSGNPIVYGGLVFAWLAGLASRDTTENALWDLGYTEGYHTQPSVSGDTVYPISRVLSKEEGPVGLHAGIIQFQLIGVKNIRGTDAVEKYGADLFIKENDKKKLGKEKIPEKIFEIERRVLIKKQ
jgi:2-methylfumaryl-CoA hydratase